MQPILWTLAFLWILAPLLTAGDFISGVHSVDGVDDDIVYGAWFLLGGLLLLAWLARTGLTVANLVRRRGQWRALGSLALEAILGAGGLGLSTTDIPLRLRLAVSEPALTAVAQGHGGKLLPGLCSIRSIERRSDAVWLETGAGFLAYAPSGKPSVTGYWVSITPLRGPWYRILWKPC